MIETLLTCDYWLCHRCQLQKDWLCKSFISSYSKVLAYKNIFFTICMAWREFLNQTPKMSITYHFILCIRLTSAIILISQLSQIYWKLMMNLVSGICYLATIVVTLWCVLIMMIYFVNIINVAIVYHCEILPVRSIYQ